MTVGYDEEDDAEKGIVLFIDDDNDEATTPHLYEPVEGLNSNQSFYRPEVGFDV